MNDKIDGADPMRKRPDELFQLVYMSHGYKREELRGDCRKRSFVMARVEYIRLAKEEGYSCAAIGRQLNRDHTSVINLMKKIGGRCDSEAMV